MARSDSRVFVIAEAGVNHNGDVNIAKKMIDAAKQSGADAVKFQTFNAENLVCKMTPKAEYQITNTGMGEDQLQMLKKLQLTKEEFCELKEYCREKQIAFLSTPFDIESLNFLISLGVMLVKIPSGEITNYPLLREIGKSRLPVILSTGMSELFEVQEAVEVLKRFGCSDITVLQCNTDYPTKFEDANLKGMITLGKTLGCPYGYSDHTLGNDVAIAAVALGAKVIEKHFTLDRHMPGPDHIASIEPDELENLICSIRNVEKALGSGIKQINESEKKNLVCIRKSIVAKEKVKKGTLFTEDNLAAKRPGDGLSPMKWESVIGTHAMKDYMEDEKIEI